MADLFLLFLFLVCLLGAAVRFYDLKGANNNPETVECTLTLRSDGLPTSVMDCLHAGEMLYREDGGIFGRITEITRLPQEIVLQKGNGYVRGTPDTEVRCVMELRILVKGRHNGVTFLHEGKLPLLVGERITLNSRFTRLSLNLYKIELADV